LIQGVEGQPGAPITTSKIELNSTVDEKKVGFPKKFSER
jgi:hypothetical protein